MRSYQQQPQGLPPAAGGFQPQQHSMQQQPQQQPHFQQGDPRAAQYAASSTAGAPGPGGMYRGPPPGGDSYRGQPSGGFQQGGSVGGNGMPPGGRVPMRVNTAAGPDRLAQPVKGKPDQMYTAGFVQRSNQVRSHCTTT
jgi:hypothetical protein